MLNARIRKRWRMGNFPIGLIGERVDLTYHYDYLGAGPDTLAEVAAGSNEFGSVFKRAQHPLVIVGMGALVRPDGAAVASLAAQLALGADGWNGYGVLHTAAARVGALDLGFVPGSGGRTRGADGATRRARSAVPAWGRRDRHRAPAPRRLIGTHGDQARTAPMSFLCRARPIPRSRASTSTPRGACRWPVAHRFARRRARTGRSQARCRMLGHKLPYDSLAQCAKRCSPPILICSAPIRLRPATATRSARSPRWAARRRSGPCRLRDRRLLSHQPDRSRFRHHGGMLGDRRGSRRLTAAE